MTYPMPADQFEVIELPEAANDQVWLIVSTNPRCEFRAAMALRDKGIMAYLPCETKWRRSRKSKARVRWPLLPGYLFVSLPPVWSDGRVVAFEGLHEVRRADGVSGLLMVSGRPATVPHSIKGDWPPDEEPFSISAMNHREVSGQFDYTPREKGMQPGEKARIIRGQFKGLVCEIGKALNNDRYRVVMDGIFRGGMEIDGDKLEAA